MKNMGLLRAIASCLSSAVDLAQFVDAFRHEDMANDPEVQ